jgi:hypothetical protein
VKRYNNGEPITKERIQDEPWYPLYQDVMELVIREGTDVTTSYDYFVEAEHPDLTDEQKVQVLRWIVFHVGRDHVLRLLQRHLAWVQDRADEL